MTSFRPGNPKLPLVKILHKIVTLFIFAAFLFNTMGYYFIFEINRAKIKREMIIKGNAAGTTLRVLRIENPETDRDFRRVHKQEIRYQGVLYDVVKEIRAGSTTVFYCIQDSDEENLLKIFNTIHKKKDKSDLSAHLITIALPVYAGEVSLPGSTHVIYPAEKFQLHAGNPSGWTPPPELPLIS